MKLNKYDIGRSLFPEKMFKYDLKNTFNKNYEIVYYNKYYYGAIINYFLLSIIIGIGVLIYFYKEIASFFKDYYKSFIWSIFLNAFFIFIFSFVAYKLIILYLYFYYEVKVKKREKHIEEDLPVFLDNLVSNLKGGIPIEKALILSAPKDNKDFLSEVVVMNQRIMMGENFLSVVDNFTKRYESPVIKRTFFLIKEGFKGGGNLSKSIETISKNMKTINSLFSEFRANAAGFVIVIFFIAVILAPVLFSIAYVLLNFLSSLFELFSRNAVQAFGDLKPVPEVFFDYLKNFSYTVIIVVDFFSSLIITELKNEKIYVAFKYIPFFIVISLFIYSSSSEFLLRFLGNVI